MPPKKGKLPPLPPPFVPTNSCRRSPVKEDSPLEEFNCRSCTEPDSAGNMVCCDFCHGWHHYDCVGVDSFIRDEEWLCATCQGKEISVTRTCSPEELSVLAGKPSTSTAKISQAAGVVNTSSETIVASTTANSFDHAAPNFLTLTSKPPATNIAASSAILHQQPAGLPIALATTSPHLLVRFTTATAPTTTPASFSVANVLDPEPNAGVTTVEDVINPADPWLINGAGVSDALPLQVGVINGAYGVKSTTLLPTTVAVGPTSISVPNTFPKDDVNVVDCSSTSKSSRSSKGSRSRLLQLELRRLEEEKELREKRDKEEMQLKKKRDRDYLADKYKILSKYGESESEEETPYDATASKHKVSTWLDEPKSWNCLQSTQDGNVGRTGSRTRVSLPQRANTAGLGLAFSVPPPQDQHYPLASREVPHLTSELPQIKSSQQQRPMLQTITQPHSRHLGLSEAPCHSTHQQSHRPALQHEVQPPNMVSTEAPMQGSSRIWMEDSTRSHLQTATMGINSYAPPTPVAQSMSRLPTSAIVSNGVPAHSLNGNQIAARHLLARDLRRFDGSPEEWPLFISDFNRSTELCGFTEQENMIRLERAITGNALSKVRPLFMQPNCVHRVIETLRMLYGRPDIIIHTLLQKVHDTPPPKTDRLETIVNFALAVQHLCATIEATGLVEHLNNPTLMRELSEKLPAAIRLTWGAYKKTLATCTLSHFSKWIYEIAEAATEVIIPATPSSSGENKSRGRNIKGKGFVNAHYKAYEAKVDTASATKKVCCICNGSCASVASCLQFRQLSRARKWIEIRNHRLCKRCLVQHVDNCCTSNILCGKDGCSFQHHPLLHNDKKDMDMKPEIAGTVSLHSKLSAKSHAITSSVLFRIVPVILYGQGVQLNTLAFLDDGSSLTLMDDEIARQLKIAGTPHPLCLKWTGNTSRYEQNSKVFSLQISSTTPNAEKYTLCDVHTVDSLQLPPQVLNFHDLQSKYEHLKGLHVESYNEATPRLLIGLNNAKLALPLKCIEGGLEDPVATKTRLGWVVHGSYSGGPENPDRSHSLHVCECNDADLQRLIKKFISAEDFGASNLSKILMPPEDARALDLLKAHTVRKNGRFETALLWKFDSVHLPDSFPMARKRLECLQKRMRREPDLAEALDEKIKEYISKGYARKLSPKEVIDKRHESWYLPIFPVRNPNKPRKLRIVWDAAAKVQGISLNSVLLKGPDLLVSLTSVLFKFREHKVAIVGDIMEMFHQVGIREADQHYQRFLWAKSDKEEPDTLVMTVMTFGSTSSPSTAQYVKNKNAEEFELEYPRAVRSIKQNHYVDDLMDSVPTPAEATKLAQEVRYIHQRGGFYIRNWISNSPAVLRALNSEPTEQMNLNVDIELGTEKVLGMWWRTSSDCFMYKLTDSPKQANIILGSHPPTKREVLRTVMTIFDPLGLLGHFLMYVKILLQEIWRSKIEWDTEIQDAEQEKWLRWVQLLPTVESLEIPRCYIAGCWGSETQLHIFVHASENGFAAVAYVRSFSDSSRECSLIGSKTRVAPIKSLSVPKLELQAAVLGARFAKCIVTSHTIVFAKTYFWSDSKTVLSWIRSDHRRYRQFVAFRISEILDLTEVSDWRWVPSKENVADEATKWQRLPEFNAASRWFTGPAFLKKPPEHWPQEPVEEEPTCEELKTQFISFHHVHHRESILNLNDVADFNLLIRSTAYVLRYVHNLRQENKPHRLGGLLLRKELRRAENFLFKEAQSSEYQEELADLQANQCVQKNSPIFNLCPFLDSSGVIRANGRISLARKVSDDVKQPVILPRSHRITTLIISDIHKRYHHQNNETVINELRQRYHIAHMRAALRAIRKSCQKCKIANAQPQPPIMAQLPVARLASFCRPFSFVGIDYFGPMTATVGRRTEKRWGVLFTCLTIRAIHIEIAHTLTTDSCILALRNFIARRGTPIEIHSDNATNFQGAERELREALKNVQKEKLAETFISMNTKWKFITPGSPHMGGSWERMVRSVKSVLYAIRPTRNPSDELLRSMLMEAENTVNSRPLTYIAIGAENQEALTPNHFILGSSNGSKPFAVFRDEGRVLRKNWLISQQFADNFWRRWVTEYLPTITRRSKWFTPVKPIAVGDIVLIADPNNPRNTWPKGRVIKTKLSQDGQVRSASVQTRSGVYERPATRLAILDVQPSDEDPQVELRKGSVTGNGNGP